MRPFRLLASAVVLGIMLVGPATAAAHAPHHRMRSYRVEYRQVTGRGIAFVPVAHMARASATITGTTYYVSATGSDSNSGTSPDQAWRTISRVNRADLQPGDGVLFQGGRTFSDDTLMPDSSGAPGAPIVFGSYGSGQARITQGVWFIDHDYLVFDNLALGPQNGLQGGNNSGHTADHIVVQDCTIHLSADNPDVGIYSNGNDWTIDGNTVEDIGNSGMLLNGSRYTISDNTITRVGLDPAISYGKHGIYLMVSHATVKDNDISYFQADGVSPRFRDSTISGNRISHGPIGIGFFEYDTTAGTSHWTGNRITDTTDAGIYVNGGSGGLHPTIENFVISGNAINPAAGQRINVER